MFKNMMIDLGLTVAGFFARTHPVAMIVLGGIRAVIKSKRQSISNKSYGKVMLEMAKSKGNSVTEEKVAKAMKVLGL